jgi:His/Glu/Gln/Arg/opine family amino acid ABC transporter permease subunit
MKNIYAIIMRYSAKPGLYKRVLAFCTFIVVFGAASSLAFAADRFSGSLAGNVVFSGNAFTEFSQRFYDNFIQGDRYMWLVQGLWVTIRITIGATLLGSLIGLTLAIIKTIQNSGKKVGPLGAIVDIYLTIIRGTPVMVQLLIIYFVIFATSAPNPIIIAILAFGINSGAYVAEIIRAGIEAVDKGQMEAGRSLGFGYFDTMRLIIIPQAIKNVLPAMFNELITLLKETSIAGYIAIDDLTRAGLQIRNKTFEPFLPLMAIAIIYLSIVMILTALMKKVERRLRESDR